MSADNTIVILKLSDQYRVMEMGAFENLYWSHSSEKLTDDLIPPRIFEHFKTAKTFIDESDARAYSEKLYKSSYIVEYGIQTIEINKTWAKLLELSRDVLLKEKMDVLSRVAETTYEKEKVSGLIDEINYTYSDILKEIVKTM